MKPIAIFFHCLFVLNDEVLMNAVEIVDNQVQQMKHSGLLNVAAEFHVGINGGPESGLLAKEIFPDNAQVTYHGLESRAENLTIVMLENWAKMHPGWNVLYLHSKGATHAAGSDYGERVSRPWREAMMGDLVDGWKHCVHYLSNHDIVCSRWLWNMADGTQHIPAGNFLWITSDFVNRLPSIYERERIKISGIAAAESRYEAEVHWGNGPRPNVRVWRNGPGGGMP